MIYLNRGVGSDGDCDFDGDTDNVDFETFRWTGARQADWDPDRFRRNRDEGPYADLIYDFSSGRVVLDASDTVSGKILSFAIASGENDFSLDNVAFPFIDEGTNTDLESFHIGQTDLQQVGTGPIIDLGPIFPVGIADKLTLERYLSIAEYASELGAGGTFDLVVVPEVSSFRLLSIAIITILLFNRLTCTNS